MSTRLFLLAGAGCAIALASPALSNPPPHATQAHSAQSGGDMQPGAYHTTITYTNVTGLPSAIARSMMAAPHPVDGCLQTSDVNSVVADAMAAGANMTCSEDHGSASGGAISGVASCSDDDGNSGTLTISGSYTATHADVSGDLSAQTQMGPVTEHIHLVSDRTGTCS